MSIIGIGSDRTSNRLQNTILLNDFQSQTVITSGLGDSGVQTFDNSSSNLTHRLTSVVTLDHIDSISIGLDSAFSQFFLNASSSAESIVGFSGNRAFDSGNNTVNLSQRNGQTANSLRQVSIQRLNLLVDSRTNCATSRSNAFNSSFGSSHASLKTGLSGIQVAFDSANTSLMVSNISNQSAQIDCRIGNIAPSLFRTSLASL